MKIKKILAGCLLFAGLMLCSVSDANAGRKPTMEETCEPFATYQADYTKACWTCDLFMTFFDASNKVAGHIGEEVSGPATKALIVFAGLWLVYHTAVFFSSVGATPNLGEFATKVGGKAIQVGIASAFLAGGASMAFNTFVNPVLIDASNLATSFISGAPCTISSAGGGTVNLPMGDGVRTSLECMIRAIADGLAYGQAMSDGMRCGSDFWLHIDIDLWIWSTEFYVSNPIMWMLGGLMGCLFWLVGCLFPMAMLDVIFRIGLVVGMLPLFVVAWVFQPTKRLAQTGWEIFFHSCLAFMICALVISMILAMVKAAFELQADGLPEFKAAMEANSYVDAFDGLMEASGLTSLLVVLLIAFWGLIMAPQVDKFAAAFAGDDFPDSCAIKALKATIGFIIDAIMFVITIISFGATASLYSIKVYQSYLKTMKKTADIAKKLAENRKKIQKMQERVKKIRQLQSQMSKARDTVNQGRQALGA